MVMKMIDPALLANGVKYIQFEDDFFTYVDADEWTLTATDSGTAAVTDAVGGVLLLAASDGTVADNDESYLHTTHEIFKFADEKPLIFEARLQWTEANAGAVANVAAGLCNAVAANTIVDNGAGMRADFSGAVIYRKDGSTNWNVIYSDSTTQTDVELTAANSLTGAAISATKSTDYTLRIECIPRSSTKMNVSFWIDGVNVYVMNDVTYASATEMEVFFGAKTGAATEALVVKPDYVQCVQAR